MSTIKSNHNPNSDESLANLEYNKKLVKDLKNKILEVSRGGKESAVKSTRTGENYSPEIE